ncbi:hypothetical protein J6590_066435 [Homalodisca vitripennis]|nr:hypothetical protein J6590_066435 [Homalodisca vitripennis]
MFTDVLISLIRSIQSLYFSLYFSLRKLDTSTNRAVKTVASFFPQQLSFPNVSTAWLSETTGKRRSLSPFRLSSSAGELSLGRQDRDRGLRACCPEFSFRPAVARAPVFCLLLFFWSCNLNEVLHGAARRCAVVRRGQKLGTAAIGLGGRWPRFLPRFLDLALPVVHFHSGIQKQSATKNEGAQNETPRIVLTSVTPSDHQISDAVRKRKGETVGYAPAADARTPHRLLELRPRHIPARVTKGHHGSLLTPRLLPARLLSAPIIP